jgi:hypothetical protein
MQSLSRGWSFLQQSWRMAFQDRDLIKPSIYALIVGLVVTVLGLVPLVGAALLLGEGTWLGRGVTVVLGAALVFAHYVVTYVFSGMTVYLIYGYLAEGDGRMDKAWMSVRREFWNIVSLAAASTVVSLVANQLRGRGGGARRAGTGLIGGAIAGLLEAVWTEASYLILPAMMIEGANLATGVKRATQIAKGNLLLIGVSTVGVRWITGFIGFLLGAAGLVLGLGSGYGMIAALGSGTVGLVAAIGLGAMIFFVFVIIASILTSYTMTAYHTCLFLWARDVEKARERGQAAPVAAPAPLAAALA